MSKKTASKIRVALDSFAASVLFLRRKLLVTASMNRAKLDNFLPKELLVIRKAISGFLGGINRRIVFEFLILILLLSSVGIAASRWSTTTIPSRGNLIIEGMGVYNNWDCTTATTYLDWGTLEPGSTKSITVYIRNEGNHQATVFMTAENWYPVDASSYMDLGWSYSGEVLDPMDVVELTLTLSVSPTVENIVDFSFDVTIGANG